MGVLTSEDWRHACGGAMGARPRYVLIVASGVAMQSVQGVRRGCARSLTTSVCAGKDSTINGTTMITATRRKRKRRWKWEGGRYDSQEKQDSNSAAEFPEKKKVVRLAADPKMMKLLHVEALCVNVHCIGYSRYLSTIVQSLRSFCTGEVLVKGHRESSIIGLRRHHPLIIVNLHTLPN